MTAEKLRLQLEKWTDNLAMRLFVSYRGSWETLDVSRDQSVGTVKQLVKDTFLVRLPDDAHYMELNYAGAAMQDSWTLSDVGVTSGSLIKCLVKRRNKPALFVFNIVTKETLPILGSETMMSMSVAGLKSIVSELTNLPVSIFRLRTTSNVPLYDCNQLQDYDIEEGATLLMDIWDGWLEFLQGCLLGSKTTVQSHFSEEKPVIRFQQRVALYIASSLGHLDLACWLLEKRAHVYEPVGVHPSRQWCRRAAHKESGKCPIHVAAERGQLLIIKLFVAKDVLALVCQDPQGRDALRIAIQNRHVACVGFLAEKLCSVVSFWNFSLPMCIYLRVKLWIRLSQRKADSLRLQNKVTCRLVDTCLVDGFNDPNMSSTPKIKEIQMQKAQIPTFLTEVHNTSLSTLSHVNQFVYSHGRGEDPTQGPVRDNKSSYKGKLPPIQQRFLKDFTNHAKSTPRENAVYYMTVASHFIEKPWGKQLKIARTLAKKHIKTS